MLPKALNLARYRQGKVYPFRLEHTPSNLDLADRLIDVFSNSIGKRRSEIEAEIKAMSLEKRNPKVIQGLSDILLKRSEFTNYGELNPQEIREKVFTVSAEYWREEKTKAPGIFNHKSKILTEAGFADSVKSDDTESWLFGDIPGNQRMDHFKPFSARNFLDRYNLEQVQSLLLQSESLKIQIFRRDASVFRQIMQMLKFHGLMFGIQQSDSDWLHITVDGPGTVLENSRSYGIELALFFPALLLLKTKWYLTTQIKSGQRSRRHTLELSHENQYITELKEKRVWINQKVEALIQRFNEKYHPDYTARSDQTILPISKNRYLIPDFYIVRADQPEKRFFVEWINFQSDWKWRWIKQVESEIPNNYLIAIRGKSESIKKKTAQMKINFISYRTELTVPKILKKIQEVDQ